MNQNDNAPPRLLRLGDILAPKGPIPVSKSTWWNKVKEGEYPQPVKVSARVTAWYERDIVTLLESFKENRP